MYLWVRCRAICWGRSLHGRHWFNQVAHATPDRGLAAQPAAVVRPPTGMTNKKARQTRPTTPTAGQRTWPRLLLCAPHSCGRTPGLQTNHATWPNTWQRMPVCPPQSFHTDGPRTAFQKTPRALHTRLNTHADQNDGGRGVAARQQQQQCSGDHRQARIATTVFPTRALTFGA